MTCSRIILQTRSITGGNFSCKRQLEFPLALQENIASCDSALTHAGNISSADTCTPKVTYFFTYVCSMRVKGRKNTALEISP